jgi:hypothetical protein
MVELKNQEESAQYNYLVCEVSKCTGQAKKIFISNYKYLEVCIYHYDEINML